MSKTCVKVNKIIPLSTVDGPGARTSIFLQACNLRCAYCHNPETINLCIHCGICVGHCPTKALEVIDNKVVWKEDKCIQCDKCISVCPHLASPKIKDYSPESLLEEVLKNAPFIRGVTVSGGECTLYPDFLEAFFKLTREKGLTNFIDTNGQIDLSLFPDMIKYIDGVMIDVKAWKDETYKRLTGFSREVPLCKNLKYLLAENKLYEIRIVANKNWVDTEDALVGIKDCLPNDYKDILIKLIAFRNHHVKLGMKNEESTTIKEMELYREFAYKLGYKNVVVK